jgi:transcriptional regulator with XRE-family HTH domain
MALVVNIKIMELYNFYRWGNSFGMITPAQCRAARGLIAWSQSDLAQKAGIGAVAVHQLESGSSNPRRSTLTVIRQAFEAAGVEFIEENGGGPGVRLREPQHSKQAK